MARVVVSDEAVCSGAPRLRGTRLTLFGLLLRLRDESPDEILEEYSGLTSVDVLRALDYCAEKRCKNYARNFCDGCTLRRLHEQKSFEEFVSEQGGVETEDEGWNLDTPGLKFAGSMEELREHWEGKDGWEIAERVRSELRRS